MYDNELCPHRTEPSASLQFDGSLFVKIDCTKAGCMIAKLCFVLLEGAP